MKAPRIAGKFSNYLYYLNKFKDPSLAYNFSQYHFPLTQSDKFRVEKKEIVFANSLNRISLNFFKNAHYLWEKLIVILNNSNVKVKQSTGHNITVEIDGITAIVETASDIGTLYELFIEKIYDMELPFEDIVVVDIGMNVGYASLQFASQVNVFKVYSYEPFEGTFQKAMANLNLNQNLRQKITPIKKAVSNFTGDQHVPATVTGDAGASINKDIIDIAGSSDSDTVKVQVLNISDVIQSVTAENPGKPVFLKIDCEGEEYGIIDELVDTGLISTPIGYILEWHVKSPAGIRSALGKAGYKAAILKKWDGSSGLIYAFR